MSRIEKNKNPINAPANYKRLKPVMIIRKGYYPTFAGSGVPIKEHPLFNDYGEWIGGDGRCDFCESLNTLCIYFHYSASNVDKSGCYEVECKDCGRFTAYYESD